MSGPWLQTHSGRKVELLDPDPEFFLIEDVAHHLARINRFAGGTDFPYSVAEHSVRLSNECSPENRLHGLLHDASEYMLVDVPAPLKRLLPEYQVIEARFQARLWERFGLPAVLPEEVVRLDRVMLMTEARDLMRPHPDDWGYRDVVPLADRIVPWRTYEVAESNFLNTFYYLTEEELL